MIDEEKIQEIQRKFQTSEPSVTREYAQHLFLSKLYPQEGAQRLLFKGGTALRLLWGSPRFSEDLDFSASKVTNREIEALIDNTLVEIERGGITPELVESKQTSGGHLASVRFEWLRFSTAIQLQVSFRSGKPVKSRVASVASEFLPDYTLTHLAEEFLVKEKVQALLSRGKPRDFYDLYFILRKRMAFGPVFAKEKGLKQEILIKVKGETLDLRSELRDFLPLSHHPLLKNFKETLIREIERNSP